MTMTDRTRRRTLQTAREAAGALEYQASISENGGSFANATKYSNRAFAIRAIIKENEALRLQLYPLTEGPRQTLDALGAS